MIRRLTVACVQMTYPSMLRLEEIERRIRSLRQRGADIIVLPELFGLPYFCQEKDPSFLALAVPLEENTLLKSFQEISACYRVVIPLSVFEQAPGQRYFNTLALIDADGSIVGTYRKSHLPDGPGYEEKFFFHKGDSGFQVFQTRYARVGCGVCWDQWFPEVARILTLKGAEAIVYPSAIGSEPDDPTLDSRAHWRRVMQGHAAANMIPIVAANRVGTETTATSRLTFYGNSLIINQNGEIVAQASATDEQDLLALFDLDLIAQKRSQWGLLADRRPDLYGSLVDE